MPKPTDRTYARKLLGFLRKARELAKIAGEDREKVTKDREAFLMKRAKKLKGLPTLSASEEFDYELDMTMAEIAVKVAEIAVDQAERAFEEELQQIALRALPKEVAQQVAKALKVPVYGGLGAESPSNSPDGEG